MRSDLDKTYSRPLEALPVLKVATDEEREAFTIGMHGQALRWEKLDEDIHVSSFFDTAEPDYGNEIAMMFRCHPWRTVSEVARDMGINESLLSKYVYGIIKPSDRRKMQIEEALKTH